MTDQPSGPFRAHQFDDMDVPGLVSLTPRQAASIANEILREMARCKERDGDLHVVWEGPNGPYCAFCEKSLTLIASED